MKRGDLLEGGGLFEEGGGALNRGFTVSGRVDSTASRLVNVTRGPRFDSCSDYSDFFLGAACDSD